jgi:tetratricopeptide (TPR) repeat protein
MKYAVVIFLILQIGVAQAQPQDVEQLITTARGFQRQGDYDNATLVLNRALQQAPNDANIIKELAYCYYLQGSYEKAATEVKKIVDKEEADEQTYQIAGTLYGSMQNFKEADRIYKKGLKKYPGSGSLYSEYGQLLYGKDPGNDAYIKTWEQGIQLDPNYSGNYYNACRYYATAGNYLRAILCGELFANLESYSTRTVEIKNILLDSYKQWFLNNKAVNPSSFEQQVATVLNNQAKQTALGITPDVLTAIRTLFVLEWFNSGNERPAYRLFDYHRQLLQQGLFEAYNQWLFGSNNTAAYQNWVTAHAEENKAFTDFQRGRVFKVPEGQYYK